MRYESGKITLTLQTDLSAAFDTIDHKKLLEKMSFYGIQGTELDLFDSFLSNRTQYVILRANECVLVKIEGFINTVDTLDYCKPTNKRLLL